MILGVPREIKSNENRVSMTPMGVELMVRKGHQVLVEQAAGFQSGFSNGMYRSYGAEIVDSAKEIFDRADMVVKVKEPQSSELDMIREEQIVFTYFHFAASEELTRGFIKTNAIGLAYETVMLPDGTLPLLVPMSEVAGRMAVQEGAKYLERRMGGKGILLGGVPGVEPAVVTILGGGVVGTNAAKIAAGLGAKVYVLDVDLERLRYLDDVMPKNVFTMYSNQHNIRKMLEMTDLLIGAVLIPGTKAPTLVNREMLKTMGRGSVIVDVAVDQGGCIETVKPTTHEDPIFEVEGVIHYCVANMPGAVPNTSTIALTNATLPYITQVADFNDYHKIKEYPDLSEGLNIYRGQVTYKGVAEAFDLEYTPIEEALA